MKQDLFGDLPQSGLQLARTHLMGIQRQHLCQLEGVIESKAALLHKSAIGQGIPNPK